MVKVDTKEFPHYSRANIERISGVKLSDTEYQKVLTWLFDKNNRFAFLNVEKYVWKLKAEKANNRTIKKRRN